MTSGIQITDVLARTLMRVDPEEKVDAAGCLPQLLLLLPSLVPVLPPSVHKEKALAAISDKSVADELHEQHTRPALGD